MPRRAFSLLEIMIVVVIMGILAAVAIPRFAGAADEARTAATESVLASVRASIAAYRAGAVIAGEDPFPTLAELTDGSVLRDPPPANPFTGVRGVQAVTRNQAEARTVVNKTAAGWNYFADNASEPPVAIFYANCDDDTTRTDSDGAVTANEL